mmetsp:Transcript_35972/g.86605  ORF Transcript_35972/g.86605 Transcript_35972/m.86605 type:complete len:442 (-) Transcript_35972:171-1496(-)
MEEAPSDEELRLMRIILGCINIVVSLSTATVLFGIVLSRKARSSSFNLYLVFLTIPDFLYSFSCVLTCLISAGAGHFSSPLMCQFQSVYLVFGFCANTWINGIVAWEIYTLLRSSHIRKKYKPPTKKDVTVRSLTVYLYAVVLGTLCFYSGDIFQIGLHSGFYCFPQPTDSRSDLFYWLVFIPLAVGIPYIYVFWVLFDVTCRSKLLPPAGKRRELSIYFFRIAFVFLFMWLPVLVVDFMLRGISSPWAVWSAAAWSHLQGLVSACLACLKPDVGQAVKTFLWNVFCGWGPSNWLMTIDRPRSRSFRLSTSFCGKPTPAQSIRNARAAQTQSHTDRTSHDTYQCNEDVGRQGDDFQFDDNCGSVCPAMELTREFQVGETNGCDCDGDDTSIHAMVETAGEFHVEEDTNGSNGGGGDCVDCLDDRGDDGDNCIMKEDPQATF